MGEKKKRSAKKPRTSRTERNAMSAMQRLLTAGFALLIIAIAALVVYTVITTDGVGNTGGEYVTNFAQATQLTQPTALLATTAEPTEPPAPTAHERAAERLSAMTLEEKVCQMLLATPYSLTMSIGLQEANDVLLSALDELPVGGLVFTDANIADADALTAMITALRAQTRSAPFFCADADGAVRLDALGAQQLGALGLTVEIASPELVQPRQSVPAFCAWDFPGVVGSEEELARYRGAIAERVPMISVSNNAMPVLAGDWSAANLSQVIVTQLLRGELEFAGVILTDEHSEQAAAAAVTAIQAGCDMIFKPADPRAAAQAILQAVQDGTLSEQRLDESVLRILSLKYELGILE